jgi:hypothetical protein
VSLNAETGPSRRPFLPDPETHRAELDKAKALLKQTLRDALLSETAIKLLINGTMGIGKSWSASDAIANAAGPPPAPGESVVIVDEELEGDVDVMDLDLSTLPDEDLGPPHCSSHTNQVVFAPSAMITSKRWLGSCAMLSASAAGPML